MEMVILKYPMPSRPGRVILHLPVGAAVLTVAFQGPTLCLWASSPVAEVLRECRTFRVAFTGLAAPLEGDAVYIGTAHGGGLVVHVFEAPTGEGGVES